MKRRFFSLFLAAAMLMPMFGSVALAGGIPDLSGHGENTSQDLDALVEEDFKGIVLCAPSGVSIQMYTGFSGGSAVSPDKTETKDGEKLWYYSSLSPTTGSGRYRYTASGAGYYKVTTALYVTAAKMNTRTVIDADPGVRGGSGYEPPSAVEVKALTEEMYNGPLALSDEMTAAYSYLFTTPSFNEDKAAHEFTSQEEMEAFLASLDDQNKDAYQYTLTTSGKYGYNLPIIVFSKTDLSACSTWQEAAQLVRNNGKITLHYQAQIHGNEPAGGEAALMMIEQLYKNDAWREEILDKINLYIIPRVNPDGSKAFTRNEVAQGVNGVNMNRDLITGKTREVQGIIAASQAFNAYVCIDGHEYTQNNATVSGAYTDILMRTSGHLNNGLGIRDLGVSFMESCFADLESVGLHPYGYPDVNNKGGGSVMNEDNPVTSASYMGVNGALSFLVETRGIYDGKMTWERRLISQFITIKGIIDQTASRAEEVRSTVEGERADLIQRGESFDENDLFVLESAQSKNTATAVVYPKTNVNYATGILTLKNDYIYYFDTPARARPRATAYVVPRGEDWEDTLISRLTLHAIRWEILPEGATVPLRQYTGTTTGASLTEERYVSFETGAIVIPMDQIASNFAAYLMEPDLTEIKEGDGSLAQSGVIVATDGAFPIYRYERDLEDGHVLSFTAAEAPVGLSVVQPVEKGDKGEIIGLDPEKNYEYRPEGSSEYAVTPAGATSISGLDYGTWFVRYAAKPGEPEGQEISLKIYAPPEESFEVYLDPAGGSDANPGTAASPVKTMEQAVALLGEKLRYQPEGTSGTVILTGDLTLAANSGTTEYYFPTHAFPLVITGSTPSAKITSSCNLIAGGDLTLENISLHLGVNAYRLIYGGGHKLVLGEGLTCTGPTAGGKMIYFGVAGAAMTGTVTGTDVTILSGAWRNVYAGGYCSTGTNTCTVNGDAKLRFLGGVSTSHVQPTYGGNITGNVEITIGSVTLAENPEHMGHVQKGTVSGDVTLILKEGAVVGDLYAGGRTSGTTTGTATLVIDGADYAGTFHGSGQAAAASVGGSKLVLKSGTFSGTLDGVDEVVVDLSDGGTLTLNTSLDADEFIPGGTLILGDGVTFSAPGYEPAPSFIWGDANGDGMVSSKDIVRLKNYFANYNDATGTSTVDIFPGADANGDSVVSSKDIVRLKNYFANYDDHTGKSTVVLGPAA